MSETDVEDASGDGNGDRDGNGNRVGGSVGAGEHDASAEPTPDPRWKD